MRGEFVGAGTSGPDALDGRAAATGGMRRRSRGPALRLAIVGALALLVANCGNQKVTSSGRQVDPKYGVAPSPRVVAEGEPVPKGGGREMVGKPYVIAGRTYVPQDHRGYVREGWASWYGTAFHGRLTANGEVFDRESVAAAHPTLPLPSYARVTNLKNKRSMIVRVNDRGPYHADRVMDVSERVAEALEFKRDGTARVRVEYLRKASLNGSDDAKLMATLREDGRPASLPGTAPTMLAGRDTGTLRGQALAYRASPDLPEDPDPRQRAAPGTEVEPPPTRRAAVASRALAPEPEPPEVAVNVPRPPQRPLDLDTIPGAATPVRGRAMPVAEVPPARPIHAGLFFAAPDLPAARFTRNDPFKDLKPQRFVALKGQP